MAQISGLFKTKHMKYIITILLSFTALIASAQLIGKGEWKIVAKGHPAESKTNSSASEQDYTSIYTIPANTLTENKAFRITLFYELVTGVSSVTIVNGLEIGGVDVYVSSGLDFTNSLTKSFHYEYIIYGTAAAGASAATETGVSSLMSNNSSNNTVDQPVNLATNGAQDVVPTVTWSGTGSTETYTLRFYLIEELF